MSYGLYCLCDSGLVIDTTTITGVLRSATILSSSSSGTLSYPDLAGRTIDVGMSRSMSATGAAFSNKSLGFSISYSSGYPQVSYFPIGSGSDINILLYVIVR